MPLKIRPARVSVYTIGHGSRSIEEFVGMLQANGIQLVADVRRWPFSKTEHFVGERLEALLKERGIGYAWLGRELGGYRRGGYEAYMEKPGFKQGVKELLKLSREKRVCVMCLEVGPAGCHRKHISRHLNRRGVEVLHIISRSKIRRTIYRSE